jgi:hypothetical protein
MTTKKKPPMPRAEDALPLLLWLAEKGAEKIKFEWDYLESCMNGEEEMWEGLAKKLAGMSRNRVPLSFWPRLRKGNGIQKYKGGATRKNPDFKGYKALTAMGLNAYQYAEKYGIDHQVISYYFNGERYTPLTFVQQFGEQTAALPPEFRMKLEDWPLVRDRESGDRWRFGKPMKPGETP